MAPRGSCSYCSWILLTITSLQIFPQLINASTDRSSLTDSSAWSWRNICMTTWNSPTPHPCSVRLQVLSITAEDKNFKNLKLAPPAAFHLLAVHSSQFSYLSSPLLRILYFSRNSACFCRRISVCFLKPLTLGNSTEDTFRLSSIFKHKTQTCIATSQMYLQTEENTNSFRMTHLALSLDSL